MTKDHPIYEQSIRYIRSKLSFNDFNKVEVAVLERLIHTSGDFSIQSLLKFSPNSCDKALKALKVGAPIITDTEMAAAAIKSMIQSTFNNPIFVATKWVDTAVTQSSTKTAYGMERAWEKVSADFFGERAPIIIFGSSPTALEKLLDILQSSEKKPTLIVGMPVGFIGVIKSKERLVSSGIDYIILESTRGGAAMAGATINALLRAA